MTWNDSTPNLPLANVPTPQNLSAAPPPGSNIPDLDDIQGDVLVGLQKNNERFLFFTILLVPAFKLVLRREIARRLTSTRLVLAREFQVRDAASQAMREAVLREPLSLIGLNLAFTANGLKKLRPNDGPASGSFTNGSVVSAPGLGDRVTADGTVDWETKYKSGTIDGVFLITAGSIDGIDAEEQLLRELLDASVVTFLEPENGVVRAIPNRGHEHFGFADGISQPAIADLGTAFPGQETVPASEFVISSDPTQTPAVTWLHNGSYMVFRKLRQLVPEFQKLVTDQSAKLAVPSDVLAARLMGRWPNGAPMFGAGIDVGDEVGGDPFANNQFTFDSVSASACPVGGHIRKVNPRMGLEASRRMMRAGIPYGPEVTPTEASSGVSSANAASERGLLFVCYQKSIEEQFEFVQRQWANQTTFPSSAPESGYDPMIGQSVNTAVERTTNVGIDGQAAISFVHTVNTVIPRGGVYFFVPSISAVICELSDV